MVNRLFSRRRIACFWFRLSMSWYENSSRAVARYAGRDGPGVREGVPRSDTRQKFRNVSRSDVTEITLALIVYGSFWDTQSERGSRARRFKTDLLNFLNSKALIEFLAWASDYEFIRIIYRIRIS